MVKDLSTANAELFEICRKNDIEKLQAWLALRRARKPRAALNFLRPSTPNAAWLASIRDPSSQYTVLHIAALHGYEVICRVLVDHDLLLCSAKDKRGCLPLHLAAWNGHTDIVKLCCEADRSLVDSPNNAQETPMHLAAQRGHAKIVQILVDFGADANTRNARLETSLDIAARNGQAAVCKVLVTLCPDLALRSAAECSATGENAPPNVVYPIHAAARHSHIQCLQFLRLGGFDINYVTEEGSALHVAAMFGQTEAVDYLIDQGINPHIKDSNGRSVLEMLSEHENQKASDLTQVIQSRDGWRECRRLIESYIANYDRGNLNSSSDSGIYPRDVDRSPKEVIWRPLPSTSQVAAEAAARSNKSVSPPYVLRPPSMNADVVDLTADDINSTISLSTKDEPDSLSQVSPCSTTYSTGSRWSSKNADGKTPRFPLTSPHSKARHMSVKRMHETVPASMSLARTNTTPIRPTILPPPVDGSCVYKPPPGMQANRVVQSDGTTHTFNPAFSYDNVPPNRQWAHDCPDLQSFLPSAIRAIPRRTDGTQTLPVPRTRAQPSVLNAFPSIREQSSPAASQRELSPALSTSVTQMNADAKSTERKAGPTTKPPAVPKLVARWSRASHDREDSLGLNHGLDSREGSTFTFACSTLERRSSSPPSIKPIPGRAPLAMPEELTRSTSTTMSSSMSPERASLFVEKDSSLADQSSVRTGSTTRTLCNRSRDDSSADTLQVFRPSEEPLSSPPSPQTSQTQIFDALYGVDSSLRARMASSASMASDATAASSCSLQMISQISSTPPSNSPKKEPKSFEQSPVRMRAGTRSSSRNESGKSFNEGAEWGKVAAIFDSFGGGVCRESQFAAQFEPRVVDYLRGSSAFTILNPRGPQKSVSRPISALSVGPTAASASASSSSSKNLSVPDWLSMAVGISPNRAAEIGKTMVDKGFDCIDQMKISLTRDALNELNIDRSSRNFISSYLNTVDWPAKSANEFDYVSDWLDSLKLMDYMRNFMEAKMRSMLIVRAAELTPKKLNEIKITKPGHIYRILGSLAHGVEKERQSTLERRQAALRELSPEVSSATFCVHYLGSQVIGNEAPLEESREVMVKLKKRIKEIAKVPQVQLELSLEGVTIYDAASKHVMAKHPLTDIYCVCNDLLDLNCFSYSTYEADSSLAHVFCVFTMEVATEIILKFKSFFDSFDAQNRPRTFSDAAVDFTKEELASTV